MKALIFNHHPEHTWEFVKAFEANGIEAHIASRDLTFNMGADYCTIQKNGFWLRGDDGYDPFLLFNENFKYSNTVNGYEYVVTMNKQIAENISFDPKKLFLIAPVSWDLLGMQNHSKYIKVSAHSNAEQFAAKFIPRFVPLTSIVKEKKYITQLLHGVSANRNSIYTNKLIELKNKNYDVILAGHETLPDKIVHDLDVLSQTSLLVHHKEYGVVCTCVMKALNFGIPIYITKLNRHQLGLTDIPDYCFIFSDDHSMEEAYEISKTIDNENIQNTFRKIKNLKNTANRLGDLL